VPSHFVTPEIRAADPTEFERLRAIESASDELFFEVGIGPFPPDEDDHLVDAAVVLVSGEPAVGFASVGVVDGAAHIMQLSVDPSAGRQGRGTALVLAVCEWATRQGYGAVTLTTFRDDAWNGPSYRRLGFEVVDDLSPGLAAIRRNEKASGDDDFGPRVAMSKYLGSS